MKDIYEQLAETQDPLVKVELLLRLSKVFLNNDHYRCEEVAYQLLQIGQEQQMPAAVMNHYLVMGRLKYRQGALTESYGWFAKAEALALATNNTNAYASCFEAYGMILNKQGRHTEALEFMQRAFATYQQNSAPKGHIGMAYNNIANTYNYMLQANQAEEYYRLAIETLENSDRKESLHLIKSNLGLLLFQRGQFAEAIVNFEAGFEGFVKQHHLQGQLQAYSHIAHSYLGLEQHAKALMYFQKGLKLIRSSNLDNELSSIYQGLGKLYMAMNGYAEAHKYLNKALKIRLDKAYWGLACETYNSQYHLYNLTEEKTKALKALKDGHVLSIAEKLPEWQKTFEKLLIA